MNLNDFDGILDKNIGSHLQNINKSLSKSKGKKKKVNKLLILMYICMGVIVINLLYNVWVQFQIFF